MIKHIVFWTLKPFAEGAAKDENARRMKAWLEALPDRVPGIERLEVGLNVAMSDAAYDVALYSEFASQAALDAYQVHPEHVAVAEFIGKVRERRAFVDYETP